MSELENVKFTERDGTDLYSNTIKYEVGEITTAPDWDPKPYCGGGLHFGEIRVAILHTLGTPGRVFEVQAIGEVVEISPGLRKTRKLRVVKELNLPELLSKLAKDKNLDVRVKVAKNPNTSPEDLTELTKDGYWATTDAVMDNPNTDPKTRTKLNNRYPPHYRDLIKRDIGAY